MVKKAVSPRQSRQTRNAAHFCTPAPCISERSRRVPRGRGSQSRPLFRCFLSARPRAPAKHKVSCNYHPITSSGGCSGSRLLVTATFHLDSGAPLLGSRRHFQLLYGRFSFARACQRRHAVTCDASITSNRQRPAWMLILRHPCFWDARNCSKRLPALPHSPYPLFRRTVPARSARADRACWATCRNPPLAS